MTPSFLNDILTYGGITLQLCNDFTGKAITSDILFMTVSLVILLDLFPLIVSARKTALLTIRKYSISLSVDQMQLKHILVCKRETGNKTLERKERIWIQN